MVIVTGKGKFQVFLNKVEVYDKDILDADRVGVWWQGKQVLLKQEAGGVTPPTGVSWTTQVNAALKANTWTDRGYMINNVTMPTRGTVYVLVDPKGFGAPFPGCTPNPKGGLICPRIFFQAIDPVQGQGMSVVVTAYKLDASNNQLAAFQVFYSGDVGWSQEQMTQAEYDAGVKWLFELKEQGSGSGNYSRVGWSWQ